MHSRIWKIHYLVKRLMEDNYCELLNILMGTNSIEIDYHYFWMIGFTLPSWMAWTR